MFGVGGAFVAVYAYLAMGGGLYGGLGVVASGFLDTRFGADVSWWVCTLVGLALVAILGLARVDINGKVLALLLVSEVAIAVVYDVVIVEAATADGTELIFNLVSPHVWPILVDVDHVLFTTSLFVAILSFHNTVTRYGFALGRERVSRSLTQASSASPSS